MSIFYEECHDDKDRAIVDLLLAGESIRTVVQKVGLSYTPIRHRIKRINKEIPEQLQLRSMCPQFGKRRWSDGQLIEAVLRSKTWVDCIRRLGLSDTSAGNWKSVRSRAIFLGLDTSHFDGRSSGRGGYKRKPLAEILVENSTFSTSALNLRLRREGVKKEMCERCGLTEWLGERVPLELEHINGVSNDHRLENLLMLCPNCHALTPTWRRRKNVKKPT